MRSSIRQDRPDTGRTRCAHTAACAAAVLALLAACNDEPSGLDAGADGPPIVVTAAEPRESGQGETMKVRIIGSGFRQGDEAVWERDGSADDRVVVEKTEFVSATQLVATISVQPDAMIASYDIAVNRPRKKGIGTEAFYVLHGLGSEFQARFSFTYDGYRSGSFNVDDTFVLDPATMDPGSWGLTHFTYEYQEQSIAAHYLRDDGLVDMMWCWVPGGRVREPGTRLLECWFIPQYNWETGEFADPEDYTSSIGGDRPGDGTGRVTFTSVTPERLAGTFSITMHVVDWPDWLGSPSVTISDGAFDLPVVSSYYDQGQDGDDDDADGPPLDVPDSGAGAINDHGVVVGWANNEKAERRAVRWTVTGAGQISGPEDLGQVAGMRRSWPTAINSHGVIVGNTSPDQYYRAGFIHDGTMRSLTPLNGADVTRVWDINDHGVVVGDGSVPRSASWPPVSDLHGLVWLNPLDPDQQPIQLPTLTTGAMTAAYMINNDGVIAGYSAAGGPFVRWQLHADGTISGPERIGLDGVNAMHGSPPVFAGVHNGQAAILRGEQLIPLEPLPGHGRSRSHGLNTAAAGQPVKVVGSSFPASESGLIEAGSRPVAWSVNLDGSVAGPTDLGVRNGSDAAEANGVNAYGWIVGHSYNGGGTQGSSAHVATLWLPRITGAGPEIITLGGLGETAASYHAGRVHVATTDGPRRCRPWPGRPDRCR